MALNHTFEFIQNNFNGDTIIVTPIYPSIVKRLKKTGFRSYELLIYQKAELYGFNVIRGIDFKWEGKNTSSRQILWDGIHPTEKGYRLYADNVIKGISVIERMKWS